MLLKLLCIKNLESEPGTAWTINHSIYPTSSSLYDAVDILDEYIHYPIYIPDGKAATDFICAIPQPAKSAQRTREHYSGLSTDDDEGENSFANDDGDGEPLFTIDKATSRASDHPSASRARKRLSRRGRKGDGGDDGGVDAEAEAARKQRAEARRKAELEKRRKVKSDSYVHDSDDEDDEERDREFFRLEEERRKGSGTTSAALLMRKRKANGNAADNNNNNSDDDDNDDNDENNRDDDGGKNVTADSAKNRLRAKGRRKMKKLSHLSIDDGDGDDDDDDDDDHGGTIGEGDTAGNDSDSILSRSVAASESSSQKLMISQSPAIVAINNEEAASDTPPPSLGGMLGLSEAVRGTTFGNEADGAGKEHPVVERPAGRNSRAAFVIESDSE